MQAIYNDLTRSEIFEYTEEKLKKLLEDDRVNHVNIFKLKGNEKITEKTSEEINLENKIKNIKNIINQELDRREMLKEYAKLIYKEQIAKYCLNCKAHSDKRYCHTGLKQTGNKKYCQYKEVI